MRGGGGGGVGSSVCFYASNSLRALVRFVFMNGSEWTRISAAPPPCSTHTKGPRSGEACVDMDAFSVLAVPECHTAGSLECESSSTRGRGLAKKFMLIDDLGC